MKKNCCVPTFVFLLVGFFASAVSANDGTVAKFKGGIGVHAVSNVSGTPNAAGTIFPEVRLNIVRGVEPAGQIWVIRDLEAHVNTNGDINVKGKGLILGGGNNAGRATGQNVFATLICEAAAPFTERSTNLAGVTLAPNGDFKINDVLIPLPPTDCASPMLLIRTADSGNWFAVGIVDFNGN
jgi:hypothetical protein